MSHTLTPESCDSVPNCSTGASSVVIIDTTAPNAPSVLTPANNTYTNDTTPAFTLTGENSSTVVLSVTTTTGVLVATVTGTTSATGYVLVTTPALAEATYNYTATNTDTA